MIYLCECGFATDDREWLDGHLWEHPGHSERVPFWLRVPTLRLPVRG